MCNQQGQLETALATPIATSAPRGLRAGDRASELTNALQGVRNLIPPSSKQPATIEAAPQLAPNVGVRAEAPLPPVASEVATEVKAVMAATPAPEAVVSTREMSVALSDLNRTQRKTLDRNIGNIVYLKGLGLTVTIKVTSDAVVLGLPASSSHSQNQVVSALQSFLNK